MIQTFRTHLAQKTQLSSDTVLFKFDIDEPKELIFTAGQYMILMVPQQNGEFVRRIYSIASDSTQTNSFELLVHIIPDGIASSYLSKLNINDSVRFQGPAGVFTARDTNRNIVFLTTGCGISPIRSMIMAMFKVKKLLPKQSNYYLYWGMSYYKDVYMYDEFKQYALTDNQFHFSICLSREQNLNMVAGSEKQFFQTGRINAVLEQAVIDNQLAFANNDYYVCGSREVTESLKQYLEQKGVPKEQIFFEKF